MHGISISRTARISLLLSIDVIFFLVEIIVGYAVGSLALVADSFHMLNDILSLIVALYAIKLSGRRIEETDTKYSYGWHRAEILAALINGVFLLALCFSIFMEAMERFFSTPEISNPRLVVIVGSLGLASNILGLFLFHEHSHSHGSEKHSKKTATPSTGMGQSEYTTALSSGSVTPTNEDERGRSGERSDSDELYGHPAATRARVVHQAQELRRARSVSVSSDRERSPSPRGREGMHTGFAFVEEPENGTVEQDYSESTPLLKGQNGKGTPSSSSHDGHTHPSHTSQGTKRSGGHSHGSMNMHALLLHVLGDALGNVGVIATGLIIWLSDLSWKYYCDPIISLIITCIIFSSALPLVKSASFILLQGVPSGISLQEVDEAIRGVDGVQDVHELHIWQLSESKVVASVHVLASRKHDFMQVAVDIRRALHDHGIHSSTIQPEYHPSRQFHAAETSTLPLPPAGTCCLVTCPPNQKDCDPSEHSCCREFILNYLTVYQAFTFILMFDS
ncbi:cation efflux protein [Fomitiporia mediterranea MF3/22]|uniref:cation efflux protein n=1 Tax=Fomitiporia mediterranea (strain MF3/22) TaxID=694068 RepID=UPI0004407752|nr:cation efflux protein [Fomitiporia mediterranea MF3/22]EJD03834.1 cation efflux protein [Fomitiporia mediterranea MF3/22]